jgi:hypothetical protein
VVTFGFQFKSKNFEDEYFALYTEVEVDTIFNTNLPAYPGLGELIHDFDVCFINLWF